MISKEDNMTVNSNSLYVFIALFSLNYTFDARLAFAAKKNKKRAPEVYSAREDTGKGSVPANDEGLWEAEKPKVETQKLPLPAPEPTPTVAETSEKTEAPSKLNEFDAVPANAVGAIAARVKIIEAILKKHHRAYDYRSNTTVELQEVQTYLDKNAAPAKK